MWMGGSPPLGYDVRDRKLVVSPAEAELARLIFRRFLDLASALLLIRELNAQGHRTKSWTTQAGTFREGRPFDKGTLYKILRNRVYIGEAVHKGKSYPAEQARIMRLLVERIDIAPYGISVTLHAAGIRSLVAELADQEAPALAASEPVLEAAG
jgi:Recombinase